jgi:rhomboid protease GluP
MIAAIQMGGYAPRWENPMIGPPATTLVRFGAKEAALIIIKSQWWRLVSPIMVHSGILPMLPNVAIQLWVGGYLNLVYGSWKWFWIYLVSGVFGVMTRYRSCCR